MLTECSVTGCDSKIHRQSKVSGLCVKHYGRVRESGCPYKPCEICGQEIDTIRARKYCSECQVIAKRARRREYEAGPEVCKKRLPQKRKYRASPGGKAAIRRYRKEYNERPQAKKAKRARDKRRKALLRGVDSELFDPIEVLDRDGWECQECGIKTPKEKRGSFELDAPELDHVVPLASGGPHKRENTQCLCRACNLLKGAGEYETAW